MSTVNRIYPVLYSKDVATAAIYIEHLGFEPTFSSNWYDSLRHGQNPAYELAAMAAGHDSIPDGFRGATSQLLLNIEVNDATAKAERLRAAGVTITQPLRDEPFGQRHLIVAAPEGVLVDVIEPIEPSREFAALFAQEAGA